MLVTFLYFHFRQKGREISWRDFVSYYLAKGLVRKEQTSSWDLVSDSSCSVDLMKYSKLTGLINKCFNS